MPRTKNSKKKAHVARSVDACLFCNSDENNEEAYGKLLKKSGITIHYFCMLFSSGLWQRGKRERDGILGFMPDDIYREQKRGNRLTCQYCRKKGATIGCVITNCRKTFHFRCGREAGGLMQFFQEFRSYCPDHRPCQETPTSDRLAFYGTAKSTCSICMLSVEARASNDTLRSPCCRKAWFHRNCIQRYASSAGAYFFKCPLCNNKDLFEAEMLEFGIYLPEQDAAWEQEPSAFQELLERYGQCDTDDCRCPSGRNHDGAPGSRWEIILCDWCGSSGTHNGCNGFTRVGKDSVCKECSEISAIIEEKKLTKKKSSSPKANLGVENAQRLLKDRLAASLRAERAARRHASSSASPHSTTSSHAEHRAKSQEEDSDVDAVGASKLLRDRRLTSSIPVVYVERAEGDSPEAGTKRTGQLKSEDADRGSDQSVVAPLAHGRRDPPGRSSVLVQNGPHSDRTQTLSGQTDTTPNSSENARVAHDSSEACAMSLHDIPPGHGKPATVPQDLQPADMKLDSPEGADTSSSKSTLLSLGESSPEGMAWEETDVKDTQTLAGPLDKSVDPVVQNTPHFMNISAQSSEPETTELDVERMNPYNTNQNIGQTVNPNKRQLEQRTGKKSSRKRCLGTPLEIRRLIFENESVPEKICLRVTRSQSTFMKRSTRSASAHSQSLKRAGSSSEQQAFEWTAAKRSKLSQEQDKEKGKTSHRRQTVGHRLQMNESISTACAPRKVGRPRKLRANNQRLENSDGNNNLADKNAGLGKSHLQSDSGSLRRPGRMTRSALIRCSVFHVYRQESPDFTVKRKPLSDAIDTSQYLVVPGQGSKGLSIMDKAKRDLKEATLHKNQSLNKSVGSDSMVLVQVTSQTDVLTDTGDVQSSTESMMDVTEANNSQKNDTTLSADTCSAFQLEEKSFPASYTSASVPKNDAAENETSRKSSGEKRKQDCQLIIRGRKKKSRKLRSKSFQKRSRDGPVQVHSQNPAGDVVSGGGQDQNAAGNVAPSEQSSHGIDPPLQDTALLLSTSPSCAILERFHLLPGALTCRSSIHTMSASRGCFRQSPLGVLYTQFQLLDLSTDLIGKVPVWNLQYQRRGPIDFKAPTPIVLERYPVVFLSQTMGMPLKPKWNCVLPPQPSPEDPITHGVQHVEQYYQLTCRSVGPEFWTCLSFIASCDADGWMELDGVFESPSFQPYPLACYSLAVSAKSMRSVLWGHYQYDAAGCA
ncbi:uncharacterized protein LOC143296346 [Babylonia areolata]|uniref:uncharacterized protein LOC143296346 n=1 Tax=Babylonia areolata TaxID=304850 RepID=UPI003FD16410